MRRNHVSVSGWEFTRIDSAHLDPEQILFADRGSKHMHQDFAVIETICDWSSFVQIQHLPMRRARDASAAT